MCKRISTSREDRLRSASRLVAAAVGCCLCLVTSGTRLVAADRTELPGTQAGRCAAAYFEAFNSGDSRAMQAFTEAHYSASYLMRNPADRRLAGYEKLYGMFGRLTQLRIALSLPLQLTLLAGAAKTGNALVMRFQLEVAPPHRLAYVTISGIDKPEVADEYAVYVATKAAPIDESLRNSTIRSVAEALRGTYVYPALGVQMAEALLQKQKEGRYDSALRSGRLADLLTEDARAVSNDKHVWVEAQNPMVQESTDPVNLPAERLRRENYHFRKVEVLPGNIGYVKFDMIHDDKEALDAAAAALAFVARSDALIFDVRDNIGGEWGTANLILGYLLPRGTIFASVYDRSGRRVEVRSTPDTIPGRPIAAGVPVYVLTSSRTGSAAEGFAYALLHLNRATIVGETTAGMAHPSKEILLNDYFRVSIPFLRSENVVTGTSWEGTGVVPQIKVAADGALEAAVADALRRTGNRK